MQVRSGRQSRRVAQRRKSDRQSPGPRAMGYARESTGGAERRHARLAIVALALVVIGSCVTYVVLAGGEILG